MTNEEFNEYFRKRTQDFAIKIIQFIATVPYNPATRVMIFQLGKAGTSVGANYRAFCRGRSKNERYAKMCIVVEEADETEYWLEIFRETRYGDQDLLAYLITECAEIIKVTGSTKHTLSQ